MEKVSIIFSILTHDYEFMMWFWLFATFPVGLWQLYCFKSKEHLTEKELIEISSDFEGINGFYLGYSIFAICLFIGFPLMVLAPGLDNWSMQKFGIEFYPSVAMFSAGYGIYQGSFALIKGVYPMGKVLGYIYDDEIKIRRVAKHQILASLLAVVVVVLFFFVTV